jgi:hypothetical protein
MKPLIAALVAGLLTLSSNAQAQQPKGTPDATPSHAAPATDMAKMQEQMRTMEEQMQRLRNTTDPAERKKLMDEHMELMQEHMTLMRSMGGPMMGGGMMGGEKGPGMMGQGGPPKSGAPAAVPDERMRRMEERVDMIQLMMEQMQAAIMELGRLPQPKSTPGPESSAR